MRAQPVAASQNRRIVAGLPFVEALARRMAASMPNSIDIGDLVQDGVLGLIDAAHRFDEARGIKFETFAERRVRGAMIDALRKDAWPRGVRRQRRELEAAREALRRELGHEPSMADLAARVGSDEKRLSRTIVRINTIEVDLAARHRRAHGRERRCRRRSCRPSPSARRRLREARNARPRARRDPVAAVARAKVIGLYYYGEVTMKQIGAEIGVNESRVSQLHARAIRRLRDALGDMNRSRSRRCAGSCRVRRRSRRWRRRSAVGMVRSRAADAGEGADRRASADARQRQADAAPSRRAAAVQAVASIATLASTQTVAHRAQQVAEPERLREPAAAALLEKSLGVGAGDVAGHEDHALRQRRRRRRQRAVERLAVDPRHLQIADHQVERLRRDACRAPPRRPPRDRPRSPASRSASTTAARQRRLVFDDQHRRARRPRRPAPASRAAAGAGGSLPPRHRQLHEERRAASRPRLEPDAPAVLLHDRVGDGQAEAGALADFLRREERVEDLRLHVVRNARAVVVDLEDDRFADRRRATCGRPACRGRSPTSIACSALMTRFSSTCCTWWPSANTCGRPAASASMTVMFVTRCS